MKRKNPERAICALLSLIMCLSLCIGLIPGAAAVDEKVVEARGSVVRIVASVSYLPYGSGTVKQTATFTGSGFFVGNEGDEMKTIVTNNHVVNADSMVETIRQNNNQFRNAKATDITVWVLVDGTTYDVNYTSDVTLSAIADLAIIRLKKAVPDRKPAILSSTEGLQPTDVVYAIGYPGVSDVEDLNNSAASEDISKDLNKLFTSNVDSLSVTKGSVVKTGVVTDGISHVQTDAVIAGGNSGGTLVTENGHVVGVNTWTSGDSTGRAYFAIDVENVKTFLKQNNIPYIDSADVKDNSLNLPLIIGIAAAVIIAAVVAVILIIRERNRRIKDKQIILTPPEPTSRPIVRSLAEQHMRKKVEITGSPILIGRSTDSQIIFKEDTPGISRRHCTVDWDEGQKTFILTDLGSTYGTFLENGIKLEPNKPCRLKVGDRFYLGEKANMMKLELE